VTIPNVDVEHTNRKAQTMEELKGDYEIAKLKLNELVRLRRSKKIDTEIVKAKISVLKLEIKMLNLEREEEGTCIPSPNVFYPKQGTQLGGIPINETR
jgi:hypothetical protein